jgi:hypothetical protein
MISVDRVDHRIGHNVEATNAVVFSDLDLTWIARSVCERRAFAAVCYRPPCPVNTIRMVFRVMTQSKKMDMFFK